MTHFQDESFYNESVRFCKTVLLLVLLFCFSNSNAQENSNMKLEIGTGFLLLSDAENLGLLFNAEPKIKSSENSYIGLRIGITFNSHIFENLDPIQFLIDDVQNNALLSFVPTFDYYLNGDYFRPYLGMGVGYHISANYIDVFRRTNASQGVLQGDVSPRVGLLLRGGLESEKWRFGLEYNLIPKTDIEVPNGEIIGTVKNSYLALSIGYTIIGR